MKEIGGYIELDKYNMPMLYDDGIKLNCGRNALAYLIKAKKIRKIYMPKFMCDSCDEVLNNNDVEIIYYSIDLSFKPNIVDYDGWIYIVNFYGQLSNEYFLSLGDKVIIDNAHAYFQSPIIGKDTFYTCRKFFGVADGAILYTDKIIDVKEQDQSFERMHFLLGRYERTANEFYQEYVDNNQYFKEEPIKRMSKLTENLLHAVDYTGIKKKRTENFQFLHDELKKINKLVLRVPEGAYMYPLYIDNGEEIRRILQSKRIYVPILWPSVLKNCNREELEFDMAKNILPLPVDQRYGIEDMRYIIKNIMELL